MKQAAFSPGFLFSAVDGCVLCAGVAAIIILSAIAWWAGFVPAFVLGHFFLFCNVVRLARPLELLWAGVFVALAGATIVIETPGWLVTSLLSLAVTAIVVVAEMRKPSYHGLGWKRINPGLPVWWELTYGRVLQRPTDG